MDLCFLHSTLTGMDVSDVSLACVRWDCWKNSKTEFQAPCCTTKYPREIHNCLGTGVLFPGWQWRVFCLSVPSTLNFTTFLLACGGTEFTRYTTSCYCLRYPPDCECFYYCGFDMLSASLLLNIMNGGGGTRCSYICFQLVLLEFLHYTAFMVHYYAFFSCHVIFSCFLLKSVFSSHFFLPSY